MGTRILIPCILLLCHEATRCLASYWVQHHSNKTSQNVVSVVIAKLNKSVKSVAYLLRIVLKCTRHDPLLWCPAAGGWWGGCGRGSTSTRSWTGGWAPRRRGGGARRTPAAGASHTRASCPARPRHTLNYLYYFHFLKQVSIHKTFSYAPKCGISRRSMSLRTLRRMRISTSSMFSSSTWLWTTTTLPWPGTGWATRRSATTSPSPTPRTPPPSCWPPASCSPRHRPRWLYTPVCGAAREIMMGEGNRVAIVTLFTFTKGPGPHAHTA